MSDVIDGNDDTERDATRQADVTTGTDRDSGSATDEMTTSGKSLTRTDWEQLPSDPDTGADLGYDVTEWEEFTTLDGSDQTMFLPADSELLKEDAFVVAADDSVVDLENKY